MAWLTALDHQLFFAVHHLQKHHLDWLLAYPTYLGSLCYALSILFGVILWQSRERLLTRTIAAFIPIFFAHWSTEQLKLLFERSRPFLVFADKPDAVHVLFSIPSNFSFPSGHTATAFAVATVLVHGLRTSPLITYSLAVWIALTRLYVGVHFP